MLEIDPQLRNNSKLQNCLVAWEDAWDPWLIRRFFGGRDLDRELETGHVWTGVVSTTATPPLDHSRSLAWNFSFFCEQTMLKLPIRGLCHPLTSECTQQQPAHRPPVPHKPPHSAPLLTLVALGSQELGARFLRPKDVLNALCSLSVRLGHLQRDHEPLSLLVRWGWGLGLGGEHACLGQQLLEAVEVETPNGF